MLVTYEALEGGLDVAKLNLGNLGMVCNQKTKLLWEPMIFSIGVSFPYMDSATEE